eukprot:comp20010_c0_seq1/m.24520 comp20010_c0_seq1/g.24520  ORF comp20010_c0_seq1/g.24520 comp20010_c0_seq1/m.24520 type:complete len:386 (-) comp20010_c0_seq1:307-1464(-)
MFHALKKAVGAYKTQNPVKDPECEELEIRYRDIATHAQNISGALKTVRERYTGLRQNIKQVTDAALAAFPETGKPNQIAADMVRYCDAWDNKAKELRDGFDCRILEAEKSLNEYINLLVQTKTALKKRADVVGEVDYYRGKVEELTEAVAKKPKEEDRLRSTEVHLKAKEEEYALANTEARSLLTRCLELKESVFVSALAAYVEFMHKVMVAEPFGTIVNTHPDVFQIAPPTIGGLNAPPSLEPVYGNVGSLKPGVGPMAPVGSIQTRDRSGSSNSGGPPAYIESQNRPSIPSGSEISNVPYAGMPPTAVKYEPQPPPVLPPGPHFVIALFDFVPEQPQELALKKGDRITLLEILDDYWMAGELNGQKGIFPCSYVQREDATPTA